MTGLYPLCEYRIIQLPAVFAGYCAKLNKNMSILTI